MLGFSILQYFVAGRADFQSALQVVTLGSGQLVNLSCGELHVVELAVHSTGCEQLFVGSELGYFALDDYRDPVGRLNR